MYNTALLYDFLKPLPNTTLLNLSPLIFGFMPFDWFIFIFFMGKNMY